MKYVYADPADGQVMAEFETPKLAAQANWEAKGLIRGVVPPGLTVTRNHKVTIINGHVVGTIRSVNPGQPVGLIGPHPSDL